MYAPATLRAACSSGPPAFLARTPQNTTTAAHRESEAAHDGVGALAVWPLHAAAHIARH